jgi:hypothetical protein
MGRLPSGVIGLYIAKQRGPDASVEFKTSRPLRSYFVTVTRNKRPGRPFYASPRMLYLNFERLLGSVVEADE